MLSKLHKNCPTTGQGAAPPSRHMQMSARRAASGKPTHRQQTGRGCICWLAVIGLLLLVPDFIAALKDVSVMIPQAVKRGSNALFTCNYDMENDTLYSVKWYKGKREFYRYTPKENPAMKVFAMTSGLNVERNLSNQSHVVLQSVPLNISGKFTCEISVEAPTFQTAMVSGEMEVVELPEEHTVVTGIQARYRIGDLVDGNCSIKYSKPAANLTWTINGIVVPPHHIKTYQIEKQENTTLESVTSAIHFMVTTQHFLKGQMRLKCTANIFDIFKEEMESVIEEDRPRIMASGRSYDINNYPLDEHTNGERGFEDHNESYLTYYSADNSASGASTAAHEIFWHVWPSKLGAALRIRLHINRQLVGAWPWEALGAWITQAARPGTALLCLLGVLAHQIINCQYTKKSTAPATATGTAMGQRQQQSPGVETEDVTMSKAAASEAGASVKCFYNCQMAMATHKPHPRMKIQEKMNDGGDRTVTAESDDDDANVASVANVADDLTAAAKGMAKGRVTGTGAATVPSGVAVKRLSATLVGVAGPWLDQRLLMTRRRKMWRTPVPGYSDWLSC
ncbi:uncharacterized protein LOC117584332 [Drosophila guanche]|uniref:Ig-like domain-containing protein n=1 Tax=Drosophila guanche TaxID=7266 RepID=A0A3B0JJP3_DROGU|nr:uncharacterized protein LOC117584332 [Drosophila guanche]SPP82455.1 Hypothetical predicted protein [Drosophila guanche]